MGFNSTLVRLKQAFGMFDMLSRNRFNSTLVRLKLRSGLPPAPPKSPFQFHAGSIKAGQCCFVWVASMFQFHAGSIKARQPMITLTSYILWFQFHAGSIKAIIERVIAKRKGNGFNSTLVRLKREDEVLVSARDTGFNSTLVRLKQRREGHCPDRR